MYKFYAQKCVVVFSHDVTTAMLVSHTSHVGTEILFHANYFFCFLNPIWWLVMTEKHSIKIKFTFVYCYSSAYLNPENTISSSDLLGSWK